MPLRRRSRGSSKPRSVSRKTRSCLQSSNSFHAESLLENAVSLPVFRRPHVPFSGDCSSSSPASTSQNVVDEWMQGGYNFVHTWLQWQRSDTHFSYIIRVLMAVFALYIMFVAFYTNQPLLIRRLYNRLTWIMST